MVWTDERCDELRRLLSTGISYSEAGAELGVSRNAIIGKANRLGVNNGRHTSSCTGRPRKPRERKPAPVQVRRLARTLSPNHFAIIEVDEEPVRELPESEIPIKQRKTVYSIGLDDCRWPYGSPGKADFFFCGAEKLECLPYCRIHARIAYKPASRTLTEQEHMRRMAAARRRAKDNQRWGSESA